MTKYTYNFFSGSDDSELAKADMERRRLVSSIGLFYHQNVDGPSQSGWINLIVIRLEIRQQFADTSQHVAANTERENQ